MDCNVLVASSHKFLSQTSIFSILSELKLSAGINPYFFYCKYTTKRKYRHLSVGKSYKIWG